MLKMYEYGLAHGILLFTAVWIFGFLYAIPGLIIIVMTLDYVLGMLGYTRLQYLDLIHYYAPNTKNFNI